MPTPTPNNADTPYHLRELNPQQRTAVEQVGTPTLVLAGAGTGKTKVLTARLAHEIHCQRTRGWGVLAVTFTNKAAREIQQRAAQMLGDSNEQLPWIGTFHSLGAKILRQHAQLANLTTRFSILDASDQARIARSVIQAAGIDAKKWSEKYLTALIDGWKNRALAPEQLDSTQAARFADGAGKRLYRDYQAALQNYDAVDFGDLILMPFAIFRDNQDVLEYWQRKFRVILVDEYQDTNTAQYLWLRQIIGNNPNVFCVGDDDQSIYGWRGAQVENMLRFERDFPAAQIIRLEQNYRSTGHILKAADGVIRSNRARLGKSLWTDHGDGEPVRLCHCLDSDEEAAFIADEICHENSSGDKVPLGEMAVLVRTTAQMRAIEVRLAHVGLPYRIIGGTKFHEREEIRDALAYLNVALNPHSNLHLERIINKPTRGIGGKSMGKISRHARDNGLSLFHAATDAAEQGIVSGKASRSIKQLIAAIDRWHHLHENSHPSELATIALEESGYVDKLKQTNTPEAEGKLENLKEFIGELSAEDDIYDYLERIALLSENRTSADEDRVQIMTLHAAKGLEFNNVFLPGWEENLFPSIRSLEEGGAVALEEERRLAYVGITRARRRLWIMRAARRFLFGHWHSNPPSRFLSALPNSSINVVCADGTISVPAAARHANFASGGDLPSAQRPPRQSMPPSHHRHRADGHRQLAQPQRQGVGAEPASYGTLIRSENGNTISNMAARSHHSPSARTSAAARLAAAAASAHNSKGAGANDWSVGSIIQHRKFGDGKVIEMAGESVLIEFEHYGRRRIVRPRGGSSYGKVKTS